MFDDELNAPSGLGSRLRRTLHSVAITAVPKDDARVSHLRLVAAARAHPPRRQRHAVSLAAVGIIAVLAAAGIVALSQRDGPLRQLDDTATVGSDTVSTDLAAVVQDGCRQQIADMRASSGMGSGQPPPPDPSTATLLRFATGRGDVVLVVGEDSFYVCSLDAATGRASVLDNDFNVMQFPAAAAPTADGVQVADRTSWTGEDPLHGPGWVRLIGRVGSDVVSVELEFPDRSTVPGEIHDGWFVLLGDFGAGVADGQERVNSTNAKGQTQSRRADLLDPPDPTETCGAVADCVTTQLAQLYATAEAEEFDDQAQILADGDVTDVELTNAQRAFAQCVNDTDFDVTVTVLGDGVMSFTGGDLDGTSPNWDAQNDAQLLCSTAHLDLVDTARALLDVQQRINES